MVHKLRLSSQFTQSGLQCDPIGTNIFEQSLPPVRSFLNDVAESCLRYPITAACFDKHFAAHGAITEILGNCLSQFLTFTGSTLINRNDGHDLSPPLRLRSPPRRSCAITMPSLRYACILPQC